MIKRKKMDTINFITKTCLPLQLCNMGEKQNYILYYMNPAQKLESLIFEIE